MPLLCGKGAGVCCCDPAAGFTHSSCASTGYSDAGLAAPRSAAYGVSRLMASSGARIRAAGVATGATPMATARARTAASFAAILASASTSGAGATFAAGCFAATTASALCSAAPPGLECAAPAVRSAARGLMESACAQ